VGITGTTRIRTLKTGRRSNRENSSANSFPQPSYVTYNLDRGFQNANHHPCRSSLTETKPPGANSFVSRILISNFFPLRILPGISRQPQDSKDRGGRGDTPIPTAKKNLRSSIEDKKTMGLENVPRCQHVKVNGTQCGSPALRSRRHCFFHDRIRREQAKIAANASGPRRFELPLLEDANSVQVALMKVIQMLASGTLDHKTASLILYALQTASINLRTADFEVEDVSEIVIDRDTVNATSINGPQWFEEDFDDEPEEEAAPPNAQPTPESLEKKPASAKHVTPQEARMKVKGVIRDWLAEKVGEKPQ
jgi:hypothetical protein